MYKKLVLSILFSLREFDEKLKLPWTFLNFQSSFHWGIYNVTTDSSGNFTFNPLFIELWMDMPTYTILLMTFQSSFHWDQRNQRFRIHRLRSFQSSFHWDKSSWWASFLLRVLLSILFSLSYFLKLVCNPFKNLLSILFSLSYAQNPTATTPGRVTFNPLFIETERSTRKDCKRALHLSILFSLRMQFYYKRFSMGLATFNPLFIELFP